MKWGHAHSMFIRFRIYKNNSNDSKFLCRVSMKTAITSADLKEVLVRSTYNL